MTKICTKKKIVLQLLKRYTETSERVIFGIYMQFTFKWDQTMLCLDNFSFFESFLTTQLTRHLQRIIKKLSNTWEGQVWLFSSSYTRINTKWNKNPYVINVKVTLKILTCQLDYRCFPAKFVKFLKTFFFYRTPPVAASKLINFYSPWNHQKTCLNQISLSILREFKQINSFPWNHRKSHDNLFPRVTEVN